MLKFHLVLLKPFLQQLLTSLRKYRASQLEGLVLVEFALLQKDTEIGEDRRQCSGLDRNLLKLLDGIWNTENTL
jgi:hypothetical protein